MDSEYVVRSTSNQSADVSDVSLCDPELEKDQLTRRILRPMIVQNPNNPSATVKVCLMHQRRSRKDAEWEDVNSFNLATIKGGQQVRLSLSSEETLRLFQQLQKLYEIGDRGIPFGDHRYVLMDAGSVQVDTANLAEMIRYLLDQSPDFWDAVRRLDPEKLQSIGLAEVQQQRRKALEQFEEQMIWEEWSELEWGEFFETNQWIFGHGLAYQFLEHVQDQPNYGGTMYDGSGTQRGDYLLSTEAAAKFTVLVEIKTPGTPLVRDKLYRNKVHELTTELTGAVSQMQSNCRTWSIDGSQRRENVVRLAEQDLHTCEPKGILIIGNTEGLDNEHKKETFQLFRRNLHNPEIITYDELLARARYIVGELQT